MSTESRITAEDVATGADIAVKAFALDALRASGKITQLQFDEAIALSKKFKHPAPSDAGDADLHATAPDEHHEIARTVWERMNHRSAPGIIMAMAYTAVLHALARRRPVGVPDAITNLNECRARGWEDGALAYRSGWNDCRRVALGEDPLGYAGCHEIATSVGVKS